MPFRHHGGVTERISQARQERVVGLVEEALDNLARSEVPSSSILDKATRVARLRGDYESLIWLQMEARALDDTSARDRAASEGMAHVPEEEYRRLHRAAVDAYMSERTFQVDREEKLATMSVREMETRIESLARVDAPEPPEGMHPVDVYHERQQTLDIVAQSWLTSAQLREILARIRNRVHDYLSRVESQLLLDEAVSDIFEENRRYIDLRLQHVAPIAVEQLLAAYRRRTERDAEARSHALTSCRRALKTLADALLPPSGQKLIGADGVERAMTDDKYLSRLLQAVFLAGKGKTASAELLKAQVEELGTRLEAINSLASKGVHADVSEFEVNQCVIQTYLVLGDIMRLADTAVD